MNNYEKLSRFHGQRRANQLVNISLNNKYIWFKNAKVASSTLSKSLQKLEIIDVPFLNTPPHPGIEGSVHVKPYQLSNEAVGQMLSGDDFFRFTFVRNPFVRLVSAYKDKIVNSAPEKIFILKQMGLSTDTLDIEITFEQFVTSIHESKYPTLDQHWMPQFLTTGAHWTKHHFVGKIENFETDFDELGNRMGVKLNDYYHYHAPHRSHAEDSYKEFYNSNEIRQMVVEYFADDFSKFGYPTELT